ncbi:MAG: matrixin family metalloprotease [Pseudomonadota bacterium]
MVHRVLGPALVVGVACGVVLAVPGAARAFCRTTTCAVTDPPPECARDADGCFTAGIPLVWQQQCVSMAIAAGGSSRLGLDFSAAENVTAAGFSLWVTTPCDGGGFPSIAVMNRGPLTCETTEFNPTGPNANAVLFRDDGWPHDPSAIALTTVSFNPRTGKILDVDMEINSEMALNTLSLQYVIGHEAGHFLGLDHSADPTALMYYRHSLGDTVAPVLQPDDLAAVCAAYPTDRAVPLCDFEPAQGFATDCGGNVKGGCGVARGAPAGGRSGGLLAAGFTVAAIAWGWRGRRRRARRRNAGDLTPA